jgi:hypothetical protein
LKRSTAEKLSILMMQINAQLDDSVAYVRDTESKEDFESYRDIIARVMASLYLDVEEKLWREHPELRPVLMDGPYQVDPKRFEPRFYLKR